jgi:hypothetical protein
MKTTTSTWLGILTPAAATLLVTLGLFTSSAAFAGPEPLIDNSKEKLIQLPPQEEPKWYLSFGVGTEFNTDATDFNNGFDQTFSGVTIGAISNAVSASVPQLGNIGRFESAEKMIRPYSWNDAYSNFATINFEVGRRVVSNQFEVFGRFQYSHADGETLTGSGVHLVFTDFNVDIPFVTRLDDYNAYGGEVGLRYFVPIRQDFPIRPYFSVSGGATFVDCIGAHTWANVFGQNALIYDGAFYNDSVVGTGTGSLGLEFRMTRRFAVATEVGFRYQSGLCGNDDEFNKISEQFNMGEEGFLDDLKKINDAGDRFSIPLKFTAKYRF